MLDVAKKLEFGYRSYACLEQLACQQKIRNVTRNKMKSRNITLIVSLTKPEINSLLQTLI